MCAYRVIIPKSIISRAKLNYFLWDFYYDYLHMLSYLMGLGIELIITYHVIF